MNAWPALKINLYDGWVLRYSNGYTKRANSISPLYTSLENIDKKLAYCEQWYKEKGSPTIFKLTKESTPPKLDEKLEKNGYDRHPEEVSVQMFELEQAKEVNTKIKVNIENHFSLEWIDGFASASSIEEKVETMTQMLQSIQGKKLVASIEKRTETVAYGFGVIEDGYLGIFDIVVKESHRGEGYGKDLLTNLLTAGKDQGAQTAYLQVVKTNKIASQLYAKLGFKEAYSYWYRVKENS